MSNDSEPGRWYQEALDRKWSDEMRARQIRVLVGFGVKAVLVLLVAVALVKWIVT